jgi:tetratricopeptide (TPR) repeat protein
MSCITCHNPHISVKYTPRKQYNDACQSCHAAPKKGCSELSSVRSKKQDDCVSCHMPRNGSIDIPHVAVTDHYIRKRPLNKEEKSAITAFLGLKSYNNANPDLITIARAFMEFYERYNPNVGLIDSALKYLNKAAVVEEKEKQQKDFIRAYFLKNDFRKVIYYAKSLAVDQCKDAWTAYRVGESYTKLNQQANALAWYQQAVTLMPNALDFQNKLGVCYAQTNKVLDAEQTFKYVLQQNPKHSSANVNLAYLYMQQNRMVLAFDYLNKAYDLDPDNEQNLFNLAIWYHQSHADTKAAIYLKRILKRAPNNERAKAMLLDLTKANA